MNKFLNENCSEAKNLMDKYLEKQVQSFEIEPHTEDYRERQDVSNENQKLKNLLKGAVEKEFAPQSLIDSIRCGIRR